MKPLNLCVYIAVRMSLGKASIRLSLSMNNETIILASLVEATYDKYRYIRRKGQ